MDFFYGEFNQDHLNFYPTLINYRGIFFHVLYYICEMHHMARPHIFIFIKEPIYFNYCSPPSTEMVARWQLKMQNFASSD